MCFPQRALASSPSVGFPFFLHPKDTLLTLAFVTNCITKVAGSLGPWRVRREQGAGRTRPEDIVPVVGMFPGWDGH